MQALPPRWSSPCRGEGAYPLRSSNQSASMRRAQLSVAAKVVRPTDLLNLRACGLWVTRAGGGLPWGLSYGGGVRGGGRWRVRAAVAGAGGGGEWVLGSVSSQF